ncbi:FAD-dependent monooxygenase [Streptomyces sp. WAC06614]|uniref:FAD-dependent monooxygenase n=1 Tax=Streptomyces sp. WAC06614 TaxID=2487416 RepID=UPI000F788D51|nr:FAD-dependent monooxygenase [Streptomyces sp. WAC06614]RSS80400.1 monooxygenase [Streptomyces sp. WAC06614]
MTEDLHTPVAVVGGGPVGLMLALFLDRHGVRSVVFDAAEGEHHEPRGNTHNTRTMEHYRRLGIAAPIRRLGLPAEHPADIAYFTRYHGHELSRLPLASRGLRMRQVAEAPATDQTPEPVHRANQMYVERFLYEHVRTRPRITLRTGRTVVGLEQNADRVTLTAEGPGGVPERWRARYAVGCDGGRSFVRRSLGVHYDGHGGLDQEVLGRRATAAHLRLPTFHRDVMTGRRAWSYWALNSELVMNLIALNGEDEFFLLTSSVDPDTADAGRLAQLVRRAAGTALPVEVLGHRPWTPGAALVAQRFTVGRVLLAGDAAHLFTPNGGFGMNTGVDDAANLAWKLAAAVQGWGGPGLLASYEAERRPVARRNTTAARELNAGLGAVDRPAALEEEGAEGERTRARVGDLLRCYGERTHSLGVQLGARYDGSPVVWPDGEPPADSWGTYTPSGVPGGRAPHLWLEQWHGPGASLFDRFGTGFTLLRLGGGTPDSKPLEAAAQAHGMPLAVLDVDLPEARELYGRDLVLVRPDQHVAWRGDRLPADPGELVALVTGSGRAGAGEAA